ncbi:NADH:flavin oxidoreductase/NADH oxidase [Deinococcus maricopensis]|uniref:NADPH dehydrogenase n=1 Tax=Deinococcus maricopensis (strain DSM 21211 / LMG 22137 / NRRL B-23946 / LB-34) TaxID=709986 RepID=E8U9V2_DEIML|nr:NADH:flavin oxidoreductase/NADH oxidase [Deinococcus maricopensis]ADV67841.1 NADPH dehydrogenase [Deinococcus maricopensis DSM 21211]
MSQLFTPYRMRDLTLPNRLVVSPMCMYSAVNGHANDFHLVHYGQFALGGAGLIIAEATAVSPEGRISPEDLGLWEDAHIQNLALLTDFVHKHGGRIGTQLAHAGRKANTYAPWRGRGAVPDEAGVWDVIGPTGTPFSDTYHTPRAMTADDIARVIGDFERATRRAVLAGFDMVEVHAAHGYLLHQFLSPISNDRTDEYGGTFEGRARLTLEVARAVRNAFPAHLPVFVRLSATDWVEGGWDAEQTVRLAQLLYREGIDVIDVSSGGLATWQRIEVQPGYQVPFARAVKEAGVPSMAVGLITEPAQAEAILQEGSADLIAVAREFLRDPSFTHRAARALGADITYVAQYERAK